MRKSNAEAAETRKRIVATAAQMYMRQGYATSGIGDVMRAAGLTAGGFYRHFESREQLVAEATAVAFDELFAMFDAGTAGMPPAQAVEMFVKRYLHQLHDAEMHYLCPLANVASELRQGDAHMQGMASDGYARLVKLLASHLMRMDYVDYLGLAERIVSTLVGAVSLSRLNQAPAAASAVLANAEQTVKLLLRHSATSKALP